MKNKLWQIWQYLVYLPRCIHLHGIHSTIVFELYPHLFKEEEKYYAFDEIESLRAKLLLTNKHIIISDLGAGSTVHKSNKRRIQDIAKTSLKPAKTAQLLFRFIRHFKPNNIVELGTCLGITSAYLGKANLKGQLTTLEGSSELARVAKINFSKLELKNITQVEGNFDETLKATLANLEIVDFIFFDGNHSKEPTLRYFEQALLHSNEHAIFVFDDIYWSKEMTEAWGEIKNHPSVTVTIDCYSMGFVFFKKDQAKEHFTVYH
jgi:predicted O-methyltransferase YrrM